jgi:aminomethyltransferase
MYRGSPRAGHYADAPFPIKCGRLLVELVSFPWKFAMENTDVLLQTPLAAWHPAHGGRMVEFAGWLMPIQYGSIIEEHHATRRAIGIFDVSHMGRFVLLGTDAEAFLDRIVTRRIAGMKLGQIRYALVTNEQGTILDDVLVYRLPRQQGGDFFALVVNASNRNKIKNWILQHQGNLDLGFEDRTFDSGMMAVQGPRALEFMAAHTRHDPRELAYYTGVRTEVFGAEVLLSRTGYTGEDGCEIVAPNEDFVAIWDRVHELGQSVGLRPAGLGARDTLRLEAAMPLYGHELSESIPAAQTGLDFAINVKDRQFIGRDAIVAARKSPLPQRVGLQVAGRRAARDGSDIFQGGTKIGQVTSGGFSPTLDKPIAMAYVAPSAAEVGTAVEVDIRGTRHAATIVSLPFLKRP